MGLRACAKTYQDVEPRVLFEAGGNMLRRQRGGQKLLLEHAVAEAEDDRLGRLPHHHDRPVLRLHPAGGAALREDRQQHAVGAPPELRAQRQGDRPAGRCAERTTRSASGSSRKIEERAAAREHDRVHRPQRHACTACKNLVNELTLNGALLDEENACRRDDARQRRLRHPARRARRSRRCAKRARSAGPAGASSATASAQASTIKPDEVHNPFRWHTEDKMPYPTLTRRAQFYIDHEWFLEAGEELPGAQGAADARRPEAHASR